MVLVLFTSSPAKYIVKIIITFNIDDKDLLDCSVQVNQLLSVTPRIKRPLKILKF